ncbi:MAG: twin-arginine translocase TatA/TatE family subunit [Haloarculaceae archaeon]
MTSALPLFAGLPGGPEVLLILVVAILLFGANKIPKLARSTGQAMGEFKKGRQEIEEELQDMEETVTDDTVATDVTSSDGSSGSSADETSTSADESTASDDSTAKTNAAED